MHKAEKPITGTTKNLSITIISDNNLYKKGLETAWGFSALIKGLGKTILFDTGIDGPVLLRNMKKLNIDPDEIDIVFLSHAHDDHYGGLNSFLKINPNIDVYVLKTFPVDLKKKIKNFGAKLIELKDFYKISGSIYSTGQMGRIKKEQSLIIKTKKGLIVITGCAHPGIVNIVKKAKEVENNNILFVIGGFHLLDKNESEIKNIISSFRDLGVHFIAPSHCTGDLARQLFEMEYGKNFISAGVGITITTDDLIKHLK